MKNKKMLAMLLALTVTAAGTPVYAADFSDGNLESVQEAAEPEKILTGDTALEEDSNAQENQESDESGFTSAEETDEFTEEDVASAFTDDTENEVAEAQSSDTESGSEEETGTEGLEYEYDAETDTYHLVKGVNVESVIIPEQYNGKIVSEIGEKAFAGCEIQGKKLGVIGLGAIGVLVANAATHLGMEVYGYDPYVSVDSAWRLSRSIHHTKNVDEIYKECDYITIHVPALEDTKGMINKNAISLMKEGVVILNFARDVLVNSEDIVDALVGGKVGRYVTDFPTPEIAGVKHAIVIPHLGASTAESEDNCAKMAVEELKDFLENGNIRNSVNFPACDMGVRDKTRITILHRNIPNMIGQFTALLAKDNVNIDDMTNKSRGSYAYTMIDVDNDVAEDVVKGLEMIEGVLKVRVIA